MDDELEAVQAIFCKDEDNFIVLFKGGNGAVSFSLNIINEEGSIPIVVETTFTTTVNYPHEMPGISLHCTHMDKSSCLELKKSLISHAESLKGDAMLMDLITWIKENCAQYVKSCDTCSNSKKNAHSENITVLLHLDHMRSKNKYIKTLQKWATELSIVGALIFQGRLILIVLQGADDNIKEFITRQKTVSVDVDSRGRSCKERMLSVLWQEPIGHTSIKFSEFMLQDFDSFKDIEEYLEKYDLGHLMNYVNRQYGSCS